MTSYQLCKRLLWGDERIGALRLTIIEQGGRWSATRRADEQSQTLKETSRVETIHRPDNRAAWAVGCAGSGDGIPGYAPWAVALRA